MSKNIFLNEKAIEILTFEYILFEKSKINALNGIPHILIKKYEPERKIDESELKVLIEPISEKVQEIKKIESLPNNCQDLNQKYKSIDEYITKINDFLNNSNNQGIN